MTTAAVSDEWLDVAAGFGEARSIEQLCDSFSSAVGSLGEYYYSLGCFRLDRPRDSEIIEVKYPEAWRRHYRASGYIDVDPRIDAMTHRNAPFAWDRLDSLDVQRRKLFDDVRAIGVLSGLTVPIRLSDGATFLASLGARAADAVRRDGPLLSMLAAQFAERYAALSGPPGPPPQLTPRERDCLTWTARGKSAWEIGVLVGISENTVNFHIKHACTKLGSYGRLQGAVRALMLGLISP